MFPFAATIEKNIDDGNGKPERSLYQTKNKERFFYFYPIGLSNMV